MLLVEHIKELAKIPNCRGLQEIDHKCLLKGEGLSEERVELLCGCRYVLLQCQLVSWIKDIQDRLVPRLKQNKQASFLKYWAYTTHTCANRNQIYEWRHIYQDILR